MPELIFGVREGHIEPSSRVHPTANVWHLAHIRENAVVGANTTIGRGAIVDCDVQIGENCKIQNLAQIFRPARIEDFVFVGPGAILTNDRFPRAASANGSKKNSEDWNPVGVHLEFGASIGAGAVCVAPLKVGRWAVVAAGAVLISDAKAFGLYVGIPARLVGWVGRTGKRLVRVADDEFVCPETSQRFTLCSENLSESTL